MNDYLAQHEAEFRSRFAFLFQAHAFAIVQRERAPSMYHFGLQNAQTRLNAVFGFRGECLDIGPHTAPFAFTDAAPAPWVNVYRLVRDIRASRGLATVFTTSGGLYGNLPLLLEPIFDDVLAQAPTLGAG